MEIIAFTNGLIQIVVIWAAITIVRSQAQRRVIITIAAGALACSAIGLIWLTVGDAAMVSIASWTFYAAIGLAVAAGVVAALRSRPARFAWPQGRYQKYRSYRRI